MTRYLKAIIPGVATLLAVVLQWVITGSFDQAEASTAIAGIITTGLTWAVPNSA